jgi:hypothetical protein
VPETSARRLRGPGGIDPARAGPILVTDAAGIGDVEFEWHDFAKLWQAPGAREDFWDQERR